MLMVHNGLKTKGDGKIEITNQHLELLLSLTGNMIVKHITLELLKSEKTEQFTPSKVTELIDVESKHTILI